MTSNLTYTFNNHSSTPEAEFDDWWEAEHDSDECEEDDYSENDYE